MAGDLAEAVECGGEVLLAGLVDEAVLGGGAGGWGGGVEVGDVGWGRVGDAEGGVVVDPEDFAAAGGDAEGGGQLGKGSGREGRGRGPGVGWGGRLGLEADTDNVERGDYVQDGVRAGSVGV